MSLRLFALGVFLFLTVACLGISSDIKSASSTLPGPVPAPSPGPGPGPAPSPTPTPVLVPAPIVFGVNGHDGRTDYPLAEAEARFQVLDANNLRSYRFDISVSSGVVLDTLIPLAAQYNIALRPMLYPASQVDTYNFVKQYANDIKVWEIGNEQGSDVAGAQARINAMVETYNGIKQASDELNADLKTSINIMACNSNDMAGRCPGVLEGDQWFLDMATASGFHFDYITFHYYAFYGEKGYWMDLYLNQVRAAAVRYNAKVAINELGCAEVYTGNTDGGSAGDHGCYDSLNELLTEIKANYSDVVVEVNLYEMLDQPNLGGGAPAHEKHFGLMYDVGTPKQNGLLLVYHANNP